MLILATISYPKCPTEVALDDARRLRDAVAKHRGVLPSIRTNDRGDVEVWVDDRGPSYDTGVRNCLQAFADGFMASANLWER